MTPGRKGAIAEAAIAAEAIRLGFDVYRPVSEGGRYDLIIDVGPRLLRAQCKWAGLREDVLVTRLSTSRLTPRGYLRTTYTAEEIDGVAAYCMALDLCLWLPIEEFAGQSYLHLRIGPTRNGQRSGVKWAQAYPLGAVAQLGERLAGSQKVRGSSPLSSTGSKRPR
jgi:hypothetical protein